VVVTFLGRGVGFVGARQILYPTTLDMGVLAMDKRKA
jgi:hypothetical protein